MGVDPNGLTCQQAKEDQTLEEKFAGNRHDGKDMKVKKWLTVHGPPTR